MDNGDQEKDAEEALGGLGGGSRDTRLIERAVRQRWPISEEHRRAIATAMTRIAIDPERQTRERIAAARTVAYLEGQNQADELVDKPSRVEISMVPTEALEAYAARLGLNRSRLIGAASSNGNGPLSAFK